MRKINRENIINGLILVFAFFPITPNSLKGLPVILLSAGAFFLFNKREINWKWLLINSSLFLVYVISILYTNDHSVAFKELETSLSIVAIPIIFFALLPHNKFSNRQQQLFVKIFIGSTTFFSIYSVLYINIKNPSLDYLWSIDSYRKMILEIPLIGQHPIYASIFLAVAILFFVFLFKHHLFKSVEEKLFFFTLSFINLVFLIFLSSKGTILALFVVVFFFFIFQKTKRYQPALLLISLILSLFLLFNYNPRMNELINTQTYGEFNPTLSTSVRLGIYDCSWDVIKKQLLAGYGVGDAQRELNLCYANKSDILLMHRFNSHNQYLDITIKTGLIGLVIFLGFLITNFSNAIKKKNQLLIMILALYWILLLVENVLSRQSGVILFFFLICFFKNTDSILNEK